LETEAAERNAKLVIITQFRIQGIAKKAKKMEITSIIVSSPCDVLMQKELGNFTFNVSNDNDSSQG